MFTRKDMREFDRDRRRQLDVFLAKCSSCHCGSDYRNWTEPFKVEFANTGVARRTGTNDLGRGPVANDDAKNRSFKIPTLREIAKSGPYLHQGQAPTIRAVLNHYRNPGNDPLLDPRIRSLRLSDQDAEDLAAFLPWAFAGNYPHIEAPAALTAPPVIRPSPLGPQPVDDGGRRGFRLRGRR
jgi:cytochrome c peroxidase